MGDERDTRGGAYDPVSATGNSQPSPVRDNPTPHEKAQWGADVRPEPLPAEPEVYPLPEGLQRPRKGPLNKDTGRAPDK